MKKFSVAASIILLIFCASFITSAETVKKEPPTPAPLKKPVPPAPEKKKTYSKLTEDRYVQLSAEIRASSMKLRIGKKPLDPKTRMGQIDSLFDKYNISKDDYRVFAMSLRKDPKKFAAINKRIDTETKALMK